MALYLVGSGTRAHASDSLSPTCAQPSARFTHRFPVLTEAGELAGGGGPAQPESEEDDEDQEARNKELQRINAELQKADDRCVPF